MAPKTIPHDDDDLLDWMCNFYFFFDRPGVCDYWYNFRTGGKTPDRDMRSLCSEVVVLCENGPEPLYEYLCTFNTDCGDAYEIGSEEQMEIEVDHERYRHWLERQLEQKVIEPDARRHLTS